MSFIGRLVRPTSSKLAHANVHHRSLSSLKESYEYVQVERIAEKGVGLVRLHRPKAMNALCDALFDDLIHATGAMDQDDEIGCIVVTGSDKAFAAGADIAEMKDRSFEYTYTKVRSLM